MRCLWSSNGGIAQGTFPYSLDRRDICMNHTVLEGEKVTLFYLFI